MKYLQVTTLLPRIHDPFWLSHIYVYLFDLCPSLCPSC